MHRTAHKKFTKEGKILRFMRTSRKITQRQAAKTCQCSHAKINHYEQGRLDIPAPEVERLVTIYGYTMSEFNAYMTVKEIPILNLKDECIRLLDRIDDAKLRAVHSVLIGFVS